MDAIEDDRLEIEVSIVVLGGSVDLRVSGNKYIAISEVNIPN
jgi:hypothetical protein